MTAARDDGLYLQDIVEAAEEIAAFIEGLDQEAFLATSMVRAAVLQKLTVIGEAANYVSADLKAQYPKIKWRAATAFRNFVVHEYFAIDWNLVWDTARNEAPMLAEQVAAILETI